MAKNKEPIPSRFYVEWHPTAEIEAACIKEGMGTDDGSSFWDWVDAGEHAKARVFRSFDEAVAFAIKVAPQDCFGGARVYRQIQTIIKDGKRSFIRWDDECFWDGINAAWCAAEGCPDPDKPDEWCEV